MRTWLLFAATTALAGCIVSSGGGPEPTGSPSATPTNTSTPGGSPAPSPTATPVAIDVELSWPSQYTQVDMDLHLVNKGAGGTLWNSQWDCYYADCRAAFGQSPDWGPAGPSGNPSLLQDNLTTNIPEITELPTPSDGTYAICVHYYANHTANGLDIPVGNTVTVSFGGVLATSLSMTLTAQSQVWYAGDIVWANGSGAVHSVGTVATTVPGASSAATCGP